MRRKSKKEANYESNCFRNKRRFGKGYLQEIEQLLAKLKENNEMILEERRQIDALRETNKQSFTRLKQTIKVSLGIENYVGKIDASI